LKENDLRQELQQISGTLQQFDEYRKQLDVQVETLQNYLIDLTRTKTTLANLKEEAKPEETLLQLGSGVMIKAKPIDPKKVFYNVGAGVIIEKPVDDAIKDIDKRVDEVEKERIALAEQLQMVINQIGMLEQRAQAIYQQLQGPSKPSYDPSLVS